MGGDAEARTVEKGTAGLALSGGGYRAGLFHLGALWRLNELGWLPRLTEVTSVSGGSIVAAFLGSRWSRLGFDGDGVARDFDSAFVKPMRTMFATTIDIQTITKGLLNPIGSARGRVDGKRLAGGSVDLLGEVAEVFGGGMSKRIVTGFARPLGAVLGTGLDAAAAAWDALNPFPTPGESLIKTYDRLLFHGKTLQDLPDPDAGNPRFTLYATNMQTGVSVRMARDYLAEYHLGQVMKPDVPLATAVAASSGFPPFYCPVELKIPLERWRHVSGADLFDRTGLRKRMDLGDGAVYDNMGLTRLLHKCETVLVSDAGDLLDVLDALPFDWLSQVLRTLLISMDQSNKLRVTKLVEEFTSKQKKRKGAYWGIRDKIGVFLEKGEPPRPSRAPELLVDTERTRAVSEMRTRLNRFTDEEQETLINWGYALADARLRRWVLEPTEEDRPGKLPFPGRLE